MDLHQKAGSSEVLELHGSIVKIKCSVCDFKDEIMTEFLKFHLYVNVEIYFDLM